MLNAASDEAKNLRMDIAVGLTRFIESSTSDYMPDAASQLLELMESDQVEAVGPPGRAVPAEELAERLETRVERLRTRSDELPDGIDLLEDAVAHLRACEDLLVAPSAFEDGEGIRWFVLSSGDEIVACYTSRPFVEADI